MTKTGPLFGDKAASQWACTAHFDGLVHGFALATDSRVPSIVRPRKTPLGAALQPGALPTQLTPNDSTSLGLPPMKPPPELSHPHFSARAMKLLHSVTCTSNVDSDADFRVFAKADLRPSTSGPDVSPKTTRAATLQHARALPGALRRDSHARGIRANVHCALHLNSALALVDHLPTAQADALAAEQNWGPWPPSSPTSAIVQLEVGGLGTLATNHWGLP